MMLEPGGARLDFRPVLSLLPHEETIPESVERITRQLQSDGAQKDPLIVDRETGAVLDGMHRLEALRKLGLENVVCALVDYVAGNVEVRRWVRVYEEIGSKSTLQALQELRVAKQAKFEDAFDILEKRQISLLAVAGGRCYVPDSHFDLASAFDVERRLDALGRALGWKRNFVSDDEIDVAIQREGGLVVAIQPLGKQDVLNAARSGRLFPCKSSMHVIDPRPVGVNVPLALLKETSRKRLAEHLAGRRPELLPPNSVYEGRRYKERLLMLGPP